MPFHNVNILRDLEVLLTERAHEIKNEENDPDPVMLSSDRLAAWTGKGMVIHFSNGVTLRVDVSNALDEVRVIPGKSIKWGPEYR